MRVSLQHVCSIAVVATAILTSPAVGQLPPIEEVPIYFTSWVDPVNGTDATGAVNDPDKPFKTLQKAIDETYLALVGVPMWPSSTSRDS